MNTLLEIIFDEKNTGPAGVIVVRYFSRSQSGGEKIHTELFTLDEIYRISLNGYAMTIHWVKHHLGLVLMIRDDFEQEKIADFVNIKYPGKGLKVIQHFAKLKANEKSE